ncbi:DUF6273 domain-containing protein [Anaerobutyricum hallii]|uniref:BIG2 domain-containing protein n=1 Tax=Anaerobutyricum hallii TaxID=39488 RepID=A0A374NFT7_9FIRM|nr:DUF6273 domain-containing protein [Anaerobutyricum hallii]RGI82146.1 hypothetical protein DXD91_12410 [Anaerobutyricum hallii]
MKKRKILHRLLVFVLTIAMLAGICPQGIHIADVPLTLPEVKAADTIGNPKIEEDTTMTAGQKVTWDCIYFGSYPQSEITSKDGSVYNKLKNATSWDNNDTTIDGVKYRRLKGEDATQHAYSGGSEQYYDWNDDYTTYHYFKYEPIKWRVLNKDNNDVFLLSDIALDDQRYNEKWATITWEKSSMRSWINGYKASENQPEIDYSNKNFIDTAFSTAQKNAIKTTKVENRNNIHYGSAGQGGNDTSDKIFLLSEREVYNTDDAKKYGFVLDGEVYDEARRCKCSTYAYAMGTWRNVEDSEYNGNALWFLRSPGGSGYGDVTAVYDFGRVNSGGTSIFSDHSVRPAIHLDLSSIDTANIYAGTVCSDGTVNEGKKEDTDNIASPLQKSGEFKFETSLHKIINTSGGDKKTAKYIYDYDENWFFTPSTTYQHGLTKMSIRGAVAGYGVMDAPHSIDTNIKYLMAGTDKNSLEFTNYESSYPDPKTNTIGYAISSKNIKNSAGKTGSLLMVTVRGGGYMDEWGGNFDLGTKDEHQGFNEAALQVRDGIKKYVEKYKDKLPYELKVWISGYSRGAATTNRVAKMLDDGAVEGLTRDNIYAFCFECPQNTTKTQSYVESDKYKNIVSIVNSVDLVPKVAMSGFEFKRYGTVYQLPNIRALADYGIARAKMVKCYTDLITYNKLALGARMYDWTEKEVKNLYLPMQAVVYLTKEGLAQASMMDKLMDDLCDVAVNRENYYMRLQANMISGMAGVLGKNSGLDTGALAVTIARVIPGLAAKHPLDNAYLLTHLIPIDENGQKIVCIPEDADYKVDLKATDNGTMTYTVMNQNLETNECSQVKSYVDIPIKEGEVYKSTFETDTESSTETLKNVSGDEVQPSIEKGASEDIKKQVNVTAQSGGSVTGGGSYTISEYAKVTAEPETNYTFAGWYENDNLISKEKEYRFCVQNNRNLSAHFSKNANQGTQKPSSNTTKPSGNTTKAPSIKPFKATGKPKQIAAGKKVNLKAEIGLPDSITKQLTWKSSNTKVATVNADGVVTVKKKTGGKKVTITASNDKIKVSASWKVTSMKGIVKKVKITGTKTVKAGKSLKLKANVTATKKANKKLQWTSSNAKYATVNAKGVVKTKKVAKGKTIKITAMATDGSNKKATFKVKVK